MPRSTATAAKTVPSTSHGMFVFEGPYARQYGSHWTPGRVLKALGFIGLGIVGFLAYGEYRFHYAPSAYWNVSPTAHIMQAFSR